MVNDLETQTRAAMDGIKQTLDASGASFKDVVHYFVFRARPRMGDIGKASAVINSYFAPFNHKPTSTNVAVLELGEPEQLIEIQMFAHPLRSPARARRVCSRPKPSSLRMVCSLSSA
jgi:enamine deaminase RidA (YjgF/YER057c/UK114 family)